MSDSRITVLRELLEECTTDLKLREQVVDGISDSEKAIKGYWSVMSGLMKSGASDLTDQMTAAVKTGADDLAKTLEKAGVKF